MVLLHVTPRDGCHTFWFTLGTSPGYLAKAAYFLMDISSRQLILSYSSDFRYILEWHIAIAYGWLTFGFVVFSIFVFLYHVVFQLDTAEGTRPATAQDIRLSLPKLRTVTVFVVLLTIFDLYLWRTIGIGQAGLANTVLPLGLTTVLIRWATDIAPAILVLVIWVAGAEHFQIAILSWRLGRTCHGALTYSFVSTSGGGIKLFFLPLLFLWIITRALSKGRIAMFGVAIALTVVLLPIANAIRAANISGISAEARRHRTTKGFSLSGWPLRLICR